MGLYLQKNIVCLFSQTRKLEGFLDAFFPPSVPNQSSHSAAYYPCCCLPRPTVFPRHPQPKPAKHLQQPPGYSPCLPDPLPWCIQSGLSRRLGNHYSLHKSLQELPFAFKKCCSDLRGHEAQALPHPACLPFLSRRPSLGCLSGSCQPTLFWGLCINSSLQLFYHPHQPNVGSTCLSCLIPQVLSSLHSIGPAVFVC